MSHHAMRLIDPDALPVGALLGVCSYWVLSNVHEGLRGIRSAVRRRVTARRVRCELDGYLIVTGAPLR